MQTDELRVELAELAREVDPFPEELNAIRKRVARRRLASASIAAVLVIALVAGVIVTTRSNGDHVHVAGHLKQVSINALPRIDALVALPLRSTAADFTGVKETLDSTDVVVQFATLPGTAFNLLSVARNNFAGTPNLRSFARAYKDTTVLGVELDRAVADSLRQLTAAVGSTAAVKGYRELREGADYDIEIFMSVMACQQEIDTVRTAVASDPDVDSYRFISKRDAFDEFKRLFQDEPELIRHTSPSDLPTSFRLHLRDGVRPSAVATRYEHLAGTNFINAPGNPFAKPSSFDTDPGDSTCAQSP